MQLRTRLIVQGAIVPVVLLAAALGVAGLLFDRTLHQAIDRALITQAGIESVSLFDRADAPHLHLSTSPMDTRVRELAPLAAIFGPDGERLVVYPRGAATPATLAPARLPETPRLFTEQGEGGDRRRVLEVRVDDPDGAPHALWLAASLEQHDRSVREFWRVSGLSVLVSLVSLLFIQTRNSDALSRRLQKLQSHMVRLRGGELSVPPAPDDVGDVISELRDAIADATRRLARAGEARDRLVANAAHELRTPLTAIRARVDVARRRERDVASLESTLDDVRTEVDRLGALARQLLDLASVRAGDEPKAELVDVRELIENAVEQARMLFEARDISIALRDSGVPTDPSAMTVRGDALRLRQAIDNLLDNAGKFAPAGSVVDVDLSVTDGVMMIVVRDRGPGLGELDAEAIFEPFFRGSRGPDGSGLGLAIVREVVEAHGGTVRAFDDAEGPGARFELRLPARPR